MIQVQIARPEDVAYAKTRRFAQERYAQKLRAMIDVAPEAFAYAHKDGRIVGCMALYEARSRESLILESYVKEPFERIAHCCSVERHLCGELGTRVVVAEDGVESSMVSVALTAALVTWAHTSGVRYVGFTTNRMVRKITDALGFELISLGMPDLSGKDDEFRRNWAEFFRIKQYCFGFRIESLDGCAAMIRELPSSGIAIDA